MLTKGFQRFWLDETPGWAKPKFFHHIGCLLSHHSETDFHFTFTNNTFPSLAVYKDVRRRCTICFDLCELLLEAINTVISILSDCCWVDWINAFLGRCTGIGAWLQKCPHKIESNHTMMQLTRLDEMHEGWRLPPD